MPNSCSRACTLVIIYCAVLFVQIDLTLSVRDSQLLRTRRQDESEDALLVDRWYRNHPSLRYAVISDNMQSFLNSLKRRKRVSHHGRASKIWKTNLNIDRSDDGFSKTSRHPPLINIKDIETPITRQKHGLTNDDIEFDDFNSDPLSLVRRAAVIETTQKSSNPTPLDGSTLDTKKHINDKTTTVDIPVIITEIIEVGNPPTLKLKREGVTLQRRQLDAETQTTCITVTGLGDATTLAVPDAAGQGAVGNTDTTPAVIPPETDPCATVPFQTVGPPNLASPVNLVTPFSPAFPVAPAAPDTAAAPAPPAAPDASGAPAPPAAADAQAAPAAPVLTGPVNNEPAQLIMHTNAPAALKQRPGLTTAIVTAAIPSQMSDTLSEILESVEQLADQKMAANEDFPCNINGSWISEAGGVTLDLAVTDPTSLAINTSEAVGKSKRRSEGFLTNSTWNLTGKIPLAKKGMIIINGINENDNKVATFIGECKGYSHTVQIIWGHWVVGRISDRQSEGIFSQRVFVDALEKLKMRDLKSSTSSDGTTESMLGNSTTAPMSIDANNPESNETSSTTVSDTGVSESIATGITKEDRTLAANITNPVNIRAADYPYVMPNDLEKKMDLIQSTLNKLLGTTKSNSKTNNFTTAQKIASLPTATTITTNRGILPNIHLTERSLDEIVETTKSTAKTNNINITEKAPSTTVTGLVSTSGIPSITTTKTVPVMTASSEASGTNNITATKGVPAMTATDPLNTQGTYSITATTTNAVTTNAVTTNAVTTNKAVPPITGLTERSQNEIPGNSSNTNTITTTSTPVTTPTTTMLTQNPFIVNTVPLTEPLTATTDWIANLLNYYDQPHLSTKTPFKTDQSQPYTFPSNLLSRLEKVDKHLEDVANENEIGNSLGTITDEKAKTDLANF